MRYQSIPTRKANGLEKLCIYLADREPKRVMQLVYQNGHLPYNPAKEEQRRFLVRNCVEIVRDHGDEGVKQLLSIHPDKELILQFFAPQSATPATVMENFLGTDSRVYHGEVPQSVPNPVQEALAKTEASPAPVPHREEIVVLVLVALCLVLITILQ